VIVDACAVLAILFAEPDAERYARAISNAPVCRMSVATFVAISIVMESQTGDRGSRQWDQFFRRAGFAFEPVTEEQAYAARQGSQPRESQLRRLFLVRLGKNTRCNTFLQGR
jgi:ribonuclease VapC